MSGSSTPLSSATTLTNPPSPSPKDDDSKPWPSALLTPRSPLPVSPSPESGSALPTTASHVVQALASSLSRTIFAYDDAASVGFGADSLAWSRSGEGAKAVDMQVRAGAGLALLGRLALASGGGASTSAEPAGAGVLTAYITPPGLALMGPSLALLPPPSQAGRLVIHVPAVSPVEGSTELTPSLGALATALAGIESASQDIAVVLSATPGETAALAQAAYALQSHVIHVFDHYAAARELTAVPVPAPSAFAGAGEGKSSLQAALRHLGMPYFSYSGDPAAKHVIVLLNSPLALSVKAAVGSTHGLGVLIVRVLRPWDAITFAAALPQSAKKLHVVDQVLSALDPGLLHADVLGALGGAADHSHAPGVHGTRLLPSDLAKYTAEPAKLLASLRPSLPSLVKAPSSTPKKLAFYTSPTSTLPSTIAHTFLLSNSVTTRLLSATDAFSHPGGLALHRLLLHRAVDDGSLPVDYLFPLEQGQADFVAITDPALLKSHDVFASAKPAAQILVVAPWTAEEFAANLPPQAREAVGAKQLRLYTFNLKAADEALVRDKGKQEAAQDELDGVLQLIAFLRLYLVGAGGEQSVEKVVQAIYGAFVEDVPLADACRAVWQNLHEVVLPAEEAEVEEKKQKELKTFEFNTIDAASIPSLATAPVPRVSSWHAAAKLLLFREATLVPSSTDPKEQPTALRPETEDRTFLVTCTVNRRLTPTSYDRNVFHLEFDTAGTGLKYAIGEALGVHGWNDEEDVLDFCAWYGVDPDAIISVPLPDGARGARHTRTVFQMLQQVIDIFGKPPKSFYAALSPLATKREDAMALRFISSAEGSATFKKLSEVDTLSFADVFRRYPSARPGIEELVELVGYIKPRHYSIASSQAAVGDRVDLLVVTVDWVTPSGSPRYGQCTRYLAGLKEGQKVTVSIKPSVMKLPPNDLQPIIMAGLGTGAAPFRAFMQHRAWQAAQKIPVGPLIYYFGSRHRSQEYLYGEEIEAYIRDGIITHAGLAFSRDTNKKIYIQHKMQNDGEMLHRMLAGEDKGVFYLCGPTWPVPDVYEALVKSLVQFGGKEKKHAEQYIEDLKEEERYVLEVY